LSDKIITRDAEIAEKDKEIERLKSEKKQLSDKYFSNNLAYLDLTELIIYHSKETYKKYLKEETHI